MANTIIVTSVANALLSLVLPASLPVAVFDGLVDAVALWIDDAYMSIPFLAEMGATTGDRKYFDDAARQVIGMSARLFNRDNGLFDHSWFADMDDDARFYWGRGGGWAMMAIAELLSVMPETHRDRGAVLEIFRRGARGAAETQGSTGLWHQLLDKTDSYLETSASAMFTFAIARGVNRGWLPPSYAPIVQSGWRALDSRNASSSQPGIVGGRVEIRKVPDRQLFRICHIFTPSRTSPDYS